jgi:hypothetical protein
VVANGTNADSISGVVRGTNGLVANSTPSDHIISEVLIFDRVLTNEELANIE